MSMPFPCSLSWRKLLIFTRDETQKDNPQNTRVSARIFHKKNTKLSCRTWSCRWPENFPYPLYVDTCLNHKKLRSNLLVGSGTGNGPHHGESRSTPRVEVELSFLFQTRVRSALWLLLLVLDLGLDFQTFLSAQLVGEPVAPMYSRWDSNLATVPWIEAFRCGFFWQLSAQLDRCRERQVFCRKISGHEESQQFLGTYNSPEVDDYVSPSSKQIEYFGQRKETGIFIESNDRTGCRWIEMHQWISTISCTKDLQRKRCSGNR